MTDGGDERGVPCCAAEAARRVKRVQVGSDFVGIMEFKRIMDEVRRMGPMDDDETRRRLLRLTKVYNYVPPKAEADYAEAMLREFRRERAHEED